MGSGVVARVALVAVVLSVVATLAHGAPAAASSESMAAEQSFANLLNRERAAAGLPTLRVNLQMVRIARDWSGQMAGRGEMSHRPDIPSVVTGPWRRLGENVGWTSHRSGEPLSDAVERLHRAFMDSPPHRANVLGAYNQVGVGVVITPSSTLWVTFNFLDGPEGEFPLFADIGSNVHRGTIERSWVGDLARGCRFELYCAGRPVTRAQMATFVARALDLQPVVSNRFTDVDPQSPHAGAINALVAAGVARGCAENRYCPDAAVSRAQMATFLARALQLAGRPTGEFVDVLPTSPHFENINAVAEQAITAGCDATGYRYCPDAPVRRDQMASFLARAFEPPISFWEASPADEHVGSSPERETRIGEPVDGYEREP